MKTTVLRRVLLGFWLGGGLGGCLIGVAGSAEPKPVGVELKKGSAEGEFSPASERPPVEVDRARSDQPKGQIQNPQPEKKPGSAGRGSKSGAEEKKGGEAIGYRGAPEPREEPLRLPVLEGGETLGLELPETEKGKLRSYFSIEKITRVSGSKVRLEGGYLQFFEEDGSLEFSIDLSNAVIEEDTRMLVAQVPVTVRTPSLELIGSGLEFNTKTRAGGLKGPVKLVIYAEDHE
jgi:hypothetical protein